MDEAKRETQARKRKACAALQEFAKELGVPKAPGGSDLAVGVFTTLHGAIKLKCSTPEQSSKADELLALFRGETAALRLPSVPLLPPLSCAGAAVLQSGTSSSVAAHQVTAQATPAQDAGKEFRLRGTSCQFTYNAKKFAEMGAEAVWMAFITFVRSLGFVLRWTATLEESLHAAVTGRLHLHVFMEFRQAVDWTTLNLVVFLDVRPHATPTIARGENQREVIDHGHFYVWANKPGTLRVLTSGHEPWTHYTVKGWWIDQLWTAHKLNHSVYLEYALKVRVGFLGRQRQVEAILAIERRDEYVVQQEAVAKVLAPLRCDFKPAVIDRIRPWAAQYTRNLERFLFLVLRAPSRAGKSTLAKSLGRTFGFGQPFVQTVQSAESPDLRQLDRAKHGYIVFDNVNDMKFVLDSRALFQANNDIHTLGESKTGIYAYQVWLYRMPVVVTVDMSAKWATNEPWISENCVDIFLDGPCYLSR